MEEAVPPPPAATRHRPAQLTRLAVERAVLESHIRSKAKRASHFQAFLLASALYFFFLAAAISHASTPTAFNVESALVNDVQGGDGGSFDPQSPGDWFTWLRQSLLPTLLPQADYNGNFTPLAAGRVDSYNMLLGGLRVLQWRSVPVSPCDGLSPALQAIYSEACSRGWASGDASSPDLTPAWNTSSAAGVEGAFQPVEEATGSSPDAHLFQWTFAYDKSAAELGAEAAALQTAGWLDTNTAAVSSEAALLNGATGSIAFVRATSSFTRGGRVANAYAVGSVALDPYETYTAGPSTAAWLLASEAILVVYWCYLCYSTVRRCRRTARNEGCSAVFSYWHLLDVGSLASLFAAGWTWVITLGALADVRATLSGPSAATHGLEGADIHFQVAHATSAFFNFKTALVWSTAFLTLRFFKYCRFNARMSVLTETVGRSCSDFLHFSVLWVLLQIGFGVWAYVHFGSQVKDWASLSQSIVTVWRYSMYVDTYQTTSLVAPVSAGTFYITFNIVLTNLTLWCGLGLVLDNFSSIQSESHERGPTMCAEAVGFCQTARYHRFGLPRCMRARNCCASACWAAGRALLCGGCCCRGGGGGRSGANGGRAASYASDDSADYFDADALLPGASGEGGRPMLRGGRLPLLQRTGGGGAAATSSPSRGTGATAGSGSAGGPSLRELLQEATNEASDGVTWADILAALGPSGPLYRTRFVTAQSLIDVLDMSPAHAARVVVEASAYKAEANRKAAAAAAKAGGASGAGAMLPPPPVKRGIFGIGGAAARAAAATAAAAAAAATAASRRGSLPSTGGGPLTASRLAGLGGDGDDLDKADDDDASSGHWSGADEVFYTMSPAAMAARIAALEWALARSNSQLMSRSASGLYGAGGQGSMSASAFPVFSADPAATSASLSGGLNASASGLGLSSAAGGAGGGAGGAANAELLSSLAASVMELSKQVSVLQAKLDSRGETVASEAEGAAAPAQ